MPGTASVTLVDNDGDNYIVSGNGEFVILPRTSSSDNASGDDSSANNASSDEENKISANNNTPNTADNNNYWFWVMLMMVSGVYLCRLFAKNSKKKNEFYF